MTEKQTVVSNAISIDVEDYFMVSAFSEIVKFDKWPDFESRVEDNTHKILDLLAEHDTKATFFILGWVAERYPGIVKRINSLGHEVASHGYSHKLIYHMTPGEFRKDICRTKGILEDITGSRVAGFRAASYSIVRDTMWALDILLEEGYRYDSSIFPIRHDRYGIPGAERFPHVIETGTGKIWEFPASTYRLLHNNIPVAGGGYFRLFPLWMTRTAIKRINHIEKKPVIFYIHPWEIDPDQPRIYGKWLSEIRHYTNLRTTFSKLRNLLKEFKFKPIAGHLEGTHHDPEERNSSK